jgi:hypothetical protein
VADVRAVAEGAGCDGIEIADADQIAFSVEAAFRCVCGQAPGDRRSAIIGSGVLSVIPDRASVAYFFEHTSLKALTICSLYECM